MLGPQLLSQDRTVVRPNFDTLYSLAQLDLTHGPVVVSSQGTDGRYYMLRELGRETVARRVMGMCDSTGSRGCACKCCAVAAAAATC